MSSQPGTGEPEVRISQVWWFETYRKSTKIKGPLMSHLSVTFFPHKGTFLNYWLWNTSFIINLTRSSLTSEVWHSGLAGAEAAIIPILQLKEVWWWYTIYLFLSFNTPADNQDRTCQITGKPHGQPRSYSDMFFSEISIGQWPFSHVASFRKKIFCYSWQISHYGLGTWMSTTYKPLWANILPWFKHDRLSIQ